MASNRKQNSANNYHFSFFRQSQASLLASI